MEKRWRILENPPIKITEELSDSLGISTTLAGLLVNRKIASFEEARAFFRPGDGVIHDPFLMHGMKEAVTRVEKAISQDERVMIYGDYDVDGTSSVALVFSFLSQFHSNIEYYIPDRYNEGYGVSEKSVEVAKENGVTLIIALDCGIKANKQVELALSYHIDYIICDHHLPSEELPKAIILNPKQSDCDYPYKELSGCGIGFKFMQAFNDSQGNSFEAVGPLLDLVALSIGADIVPITDENRTLAALGLGRVQSHPRPALKTILQLNNKLERCSISDLVFTVAPRINAAGRLKSGTLAVELLCSETELLASQLSKNVTQLNEERKLIEQQITDHASTFLADTDDQVTSVVYHPDWHKGVIGIVASRLIENWYRPTIVLTDSKDVAGGSVRSVSGFDVYAALSECADYLIQFGGHKYAAGLTLEKDKIEPFKKRFEEVVREMINPELLVPEIKIETELTFSEIQGDSRDAIPKFVRILEQFAPYGPGNMKPYFVSRNVQTRYPKVLGTDHLSFVASQQINLSYRCIAFKLAEKVDLLKAPVDIVYTIERNQWNGTENVQLHIRDIKSSDL